MIWKIVAKKEEPKGPKERWNIKKVEKKVYKMTRWPNDQTFVMVIINKNKNGLVLLCRGQYCSKKKKNHAQDNHVEELDNVCPQSITKSTKNRHTSSLHKRDALSKRKRISQ